MARKPYLTSSAQKILQYIREKKLQPGDMLPRDKVLSEELGMSTGALRPGKAVLVAFGVIQPKRRAGTCVRNLTWQEISQGGERLKGEILAALGSTPELDKSQTTFPIIDARAAAKKLNHVQSALAALAEELT